MQTFRMAAFVPEIDDRGARRTDLPLALNSVGTYSLQGHSFTRIRPRGREDYLLVYLWKGASRGLEGGEPVPLPPGHLMVFRPGERHYHRVEGDEPVEGTWIHFSGHGAEEWLARCGFGTGNVFPVGVQDGLRALADRMLLEAQLDQPLAEAVAGALLQEFLAAAGRALKSGTAAAGDALLLEIVHLLENDYAHPWDMETLARRAGLSVNRLIRRFRGLTGQSPKAYLIEVRLRHARQLLGESDLPVAAVAALVGYDDALYFSRLFRVHGGVSPRAWRSRGPGALPTPGAAPTPTEPSGGAARFPGENR